MIFVTHSLLKKNEALFQQHGLLSLEPCTYKCKSPIFNCFGLMHRKHRLTTQFFFNDIYQICFELNFEWSINFGGTLPLLVH